MNAYEWAGLMVLAAIVALAVVVVACVVLVLLALGQAVGGVL